MSRDTDVLVTNAMALPEVQWSMLAKVSLTNSTLYCATGMRFVYDGVNTYSPVGGFGGVETVSEVADVSPRSLRMWLRLVNSGDAGEALSEALFNKEVRLYRAALTGSGTLVSTPQLAFRGRMNEVSVRMADQSKGNYIDISLERRLRRESASAFYNKETLSLVSSGDTGFDYVNQIQGFQSNWGGKDQSLSGLVGGSGTIGDTQPVRRPPPK